jgi:hypothetical protein
MQRLGVSQRCLSRGAKMLLIGIAACEYLLSFQGAPRLGANAAQRHAYALHALALHLCHNGSGCQREFIRGTVTTLEVVRTRAARQPWQRLLAPGARYMPATPYQGTHSSLSLGRGLG